MPRTLNFELYFYELELAVRGVFVKFTSLHP